MFVVKGVWGSQDSLNGESERRPPQPPAPPIWTPIASPTPERKSFRPVPFESPTLQRKPQTKVIITLLFMVQVEAKFPLFLGSPTTTVESTKLFTNTN